MEILNKIAITNDFCNPAIVIAIVLVFGAIGALGVIFGSAPYNSIREKISIPVMIFGIVGMILCFMICLVINSIVPGAYTGRYRYEVKISDSTTFKEVTDNYKIIDNRGEIWILEDKR